MMMMMMKMMRLRLRMMKVVLFGPGVVEFLINYLTN
jgi:hypothetical protein